MQGLNISTLPDGRRAIIIRTSDSIAFKQCRRKWGFSSHLKMNLGAKELSPYLWFGSGVHYALEDFHGYNKFGRASEAFTAYCVATAKNYLRELPSDAKEHMELGRVLLDYYEDKWLKAAKRQPHQTYWEDGIPQVEVNFEIPVPLDEFPHIRALCDRLGVDCVLYRGTLDAVSIDLWGNLWVVEYKTAKRAEHLHYQTDPQITRYVWAAQQIYDKPVVGVIYQQFIKNTPQPPRLLGSGRISTASNLITSAPLYEEALTKLYGCKERAPKENQEYLKQIIFSEDENRDRYIQREFISKSEIQTQNEAQLILMELEDMLNPDLPLYPNPTRDCSRMCSFLSPCISMNSGHDWESELEMSYASRDQDIDRVWRRRLPPAEQLMALTERGEIPDLSGIQAHAISSAERRAAEAAAREYGADTFTMGEEPLNEGPLTFNMSEIKPLG